MNLEDKIEYIYREGIMGFLLEEQLDAQEDGRARRAQRVLL
jgi:hypothetical protein